MIVSDIVAGDSFEFSFYRPDFPTGVWDMKLAFVRGGSQLIFFNATEPVADTYLVTGTSALTAPLVPGPVEVYAVFTVTADPTLRVSEFVGSITILPNPLGTLPASENQLALTAVNFSIKTILSQPESSSSYNGQTYTMHNVKDLFEIRDRLTMLVNAELVAAGIRGKRNTRLIVTRFV